MPSMGFRRVIRRELVFISSADLELNEDLRAGADGLPRVRWRLPAGWKLGAAAAYSRYHMCSHVDATLSCTREEQGIGGTEQVSAAIVTLTPAARSPP